MKKRLKKLQMQLLKVHQENITKKKDSLTLQPAASKNDDEKTVVENTTPPIKSYN